MCESLLAVLGFSSVDIRSETGGKRMPARHASTINTSDRPWWPFSIGHIETCSALNMRMSNLHRRVPDRLRSIEERKQLAQLLGHVFPVGETGSFTGIIKAIDECVEFKEGR